IIKYSSREIEKEDLNTIINTSLFTSFQNKNESCHFSVVCSQECITKINSIIKKDGEDVFMGAPVVIIISSSKSDSSAQEKCIEASKTMALAAHSLGIASYIIEDFSTLKNSSKLNDCQQELMIPEDFVPYEGIVLGYKADSEPYFSEQISDNITYIY
ncbi:MAG: nitroreductase family protein, partial [Spirochaetales bacterium]|nr:nitroreductase family protein [Spirochaetales bacterium]